jgi:hypothetical protein
MDTACAIPSHPQVDAARPAAAASVRVVLTGELGSVSAALQVVHALRLSGRENAVLHLAVLILKRVQCLRFRRMYTDVLAHPDWRPAAHFFLQELYGERDFSDRDAQFGRIAPAMQRLFPKAVLGVATTLTQLHAISEQYDYAMAHALLDLHPQGLTDRLVMASYVQAWRRVGQAPGRAEQLALVQQLGMGLAQLTRTAGLRTMLRMMRGPAHAAGLQDLQLFLEQGFDTFAGLQRSKAGVSGFLSLVDEREKAWMGRLFASDQTNTYDHAQWPELE